MARWKALEDFESYSVAADLVGGAGGSGWTGNWVDGGGGVFTAENNPDGAGKVAQCAANVSGTFYTRDFANDLLNSRVRASIRISATNPNGLCGFALQQGGTPQAVVVFASTGQLQVFDGDAANYVDVQAYAANTWYVVDVDFGSPTADEFRIRVNGGAWSSYYRSADTNPINNSSRFSMNCNATNSVTFWVDAITYIPPEQGSAQVFGGSLSRVRLPAEDAEIPAAEIDLNTGDGMTVTGWIKRTEGQGGQYKPVVWAPDVSSGYFFFGFSSAASPSEDFYIEGSIRSDSHESFAGQPALDAWFFFAYTLSINSPDNEDHAYWYDADFVQQEHITSATAGTMNQDYIEIGTQDSFSSGAIGFVAQGRVFNRVLSEAEIEAEMMSSDPVATADLVSAFEDDPSIDVGSHGYAWDNFGLSITPDEYPPNYSPPPTPDVPTLYVVRSGIRLN